jgi:hypothetical protein
VKNKIITAGFGTRPGKIDWKLLIFLILFLNFKLIIKVAAIGLIYLLRPDFKLGYSIKNSRLPFFYVLVIGIAVFNWLISGMVGNFNYTLVFVTGISFWVLCVLAIHQVKVAVEKNDPEVLHQTILVFFIINIVVSFAVYASIVWEIKEVNAYRYQGNYQKYFIGTGDYIKGLTFDTSTTNAVISAMGVIYFLLRGKNIFALLCMTVLLLTGSNFTNFLLVCTLLYVFFFQSNKDQKSIIVVCLLMLITFLAKVSPQNNQYVTTAIQKVFNIQNHAGPDRKADIPITQKPDSILTSEEKKQKFAQLYLDSINISLAKKNTEKTLPGPLSAIGFMERPVVPGDSIHTPTFQHRNDTNAIEKKLLQFVDTAARQLPVSSRLTAQSRLPGKLIAFQQTWKFFRQHPAKLVTGTGIGNFSSKLAFRATAMKLTGSYPARFAYINDDFKLNHLDLYAYYFTDKDDFHSVANSPNSTYDQLLSEYGLAGLLSFAIFYIAFFITKLKRNSVAIPLILFMLGVFFIEYWFEHLSVVIFFELLVLLNIKETTAIKFETT